MIPLDQLLPSLQALGLWTYWIVGLICLLEAFMLTGLFVPGALAIVTAGMLVEQGAVDYFDMAWFVALGSALGGTGSFHLGRLAARGLARRPGNGSGKAERARRLLSRYGGFAMVIGRFLGPVSGFVAFAAALAGMGGRRFLAWNLASAAIQAPALLAAGYFLGNSLSVLGGAATRTILFSGAVLAALVALWFVVSRIWRALPLARSLLRAVLRAVAENPDVAGWIARHPRTARIVARRFDPSRPGGLATTLFLAALLLALALFAALAWQVVHGGPIVALDRRLARLLFAFRDPGLIRFFTLVTALGDRNTVITLMVGLSLALWLAGRGRLAIGLWLGATSSAATVALLKLLFARPRPELGYFAEPSMSFPSGHAAGSVASLALMIFLLWRARWIGGFTAAIAAVSVAFLVGLSRIYLIEHYLTDVIGGWLIGAIWALVGAGLGHGLASRSPPSPAQAAPPAAPPSPAPAPAPASPRARRRRAPGWSLGLVAALTVGWAGYLTLTYSKPLRTPTADAHARIVADIPALFARAGAPALTESILGTARQPISLVIVTPDARALAAALRDAGWNSAQKPGLSTMARAVRAALNGRSAPDAPLGPTFWNARPEDLAFRKTALRGAVRRHHLARFWVTRYRTPSGNEIIVATAGLDDTGHWGLRHRIAPDIDRERDLLVADLLASGRLVERARFQIVAARPGNSPADDAPWFTDGRAVLLWTRN